MYQHFIHLRTLRIEDDRDGLWGDPPEGAWAGNPAICAWRAWQHSKVRPRHAEHPSSGCSDIVPKLRGERTAVTQCMSAQQCVSPCHAMLQEACGRAGAAVPSLHGAAQAGTGASCSSSTPLARHALAWRCRPCQVARQLQSAACLLESAQEAESQQQGCGKDERCGDLVAHGSRLVMCAASINGHGLALGWHSQAESWVFQRLPEAPAGCGCRTACQTGVCGLGIFLSPST